MSSILNSIAVNIMSVIFCLRYLPLKSALRLPVRLYPGYKVIGLKRGNLILPDSLTRGMIFLGCPPTAGLPGCTGGMIICGRGSILKFNGRAFIRKGTSLRMDGDGTIELGDSVYINGNCFLRSDCSIRIGDGCRIGWNVTVNTTDGHTIIIDGKEKPRSKPIEIAEHCWIGSHSTIGKGVTMNRGSVLAQSSLLTKTFPEKCLLGGIPAKIIRDDIDWK